VLKNEVSQDKDQYVMIRKKDIDFILEQLEKIKAEAKKA
jgi:hypothetical protein